MRRDQTAEKAQNFAHSTVLEQCRKRGRYRADFFMHSRYALHFAGTKTVMDDVTSALNTIIAGGGRRGHPLRVARLPSATQEPLRVHEPASGLVEFEGGGERGPASIFRYQQPRRRPRES